MDFDAESGQLFVSSFDDGMIYRYKLNTLNIREPVKTLDTWKGEKKVKDIKYCPIRQELYCGYGGGKMSVYELSTGSKGAVCKCFGNSRSSFGPQQ